MEQELEIIFTREKLRLTTPRKVVFKVLKESTAPLSVAMITDRCQSIDRTSVYRTIDIFVQLGIVKAIPLGWKQRYELADPFKLHHHHLSCTNCKRLIDLHSSRIEHIVATIASEHNFVVDDHTFEIRGLCDKCR